MKLITDFIYGFRRCDLTILIVLFCIYILYLYSLRIYFSIHRYTARLIKHSFYFYPNPKAGRGSSAGGRLLPQFTSEHSPELVSLSSRFVYRAFIFQPIDITYYLLGNPRFCTFYFIFATGMIVIVDHRSIRYLSRLSTITNYYI